MKLKAALSVVHTGSSCLIVLSLMMNKEVIFVNGTLEFIDPKRHYRL
jgi:hypothetical protein